MFCILILFSSISILNEYKQPIDLIEVINNVPNNSNITTVLWEILHEEELKTLEKRFYYPYQNTLKNNYKLPIIRDCKAFLNEILGISNEKIKDKFGFFYWVDSDRDIGVSFALREFSRILQGEMSNVPILYINLKQLHEFFRSDLHLAMKILNLDILEKVLENFNKKGLIPVLIIDSIEKSFSQEINDSKSCFKMSDYNKINKCLEIHKYEKNIQNMGRSNIFEKLLLLFQKFELKIIVINYDANKEINDFPHFIERKRVRNRHRDWEIYILTVLNEYIGNKEKKLNSDHIQKWRQYLEIDFRVIANYYHNMNHYKSPDDYMYVTFKKTKENIEEYKLNFLEKTFGSLIQIESLTKMQVNKNNLTDPLDQDILSQLIMENILIQEGNFIILSNRTIINSLK